MINNDNGQLVLWVQLKALEKTFKHLDDGKSASSYASFYTLPAFCHQHFQFNFSDLTCLGQNRACQLPNYSKQGLYKRTQIAALWQAKLYLHWQASAAACRLPRRCSRRDAAVDDSFLIYCGISLTAARYNYSYYDSFLIHCGISSTAAPPR